MSNCGTRTDGAAMNNGGEISGNTAEAKPETCRRELGSTPSASTNYASNSYRVALADRLLKYAFVEAIADLDSAQWADFKALIQKALRDDGPKYEIVAYVVRSRSDGSFFDRIAPINYIEFKDRLDELRAEPWVVNGSADIVPLYELRECATHGER